MPSSKQLAELCHTLATMLGAGVPVSQALQAGARQSRSGALRRAVAAAARRIQGGESLAEALGAGGCFPALFLYLVEAGEHSGALERVLEELRQLYEFQNRLWRRFLARIAMPVFQYVLAVFVLALVFKLVRSFSGGSGSMLPALALGYGVPLAVVAAYVVVAKSLAGRRFCHEGLLRVPAVRAVVRSVALARFSLVMHLSTEAGVSIEQALDRALGATGNAAFAARSALVRRAVVEGSSLTRALARTALFPRVYLEMMEVAEETGTLSEQFDRLAGEYSERAEEAISFLTGVAARLIWVAVAGFIVYFVFRIFMGHIAAINELTGGRR